MQRLTGQQLLLDESMGVEHARYFGTPMVAERLTEWLGAGLRDPA